MTQKPPLKKFYGKYRGTVEQNIDPEFRGRIQCTVPDVLGPGVISGWCEACAPLAGPTGPPTPRGSRRGGNYFESGFRPSETLATRAVCVSAHNRDTADAMIRRPPSCSNI